MKKITGFLLSLALCFSCLAPAALAYEPVKVDVTPKVTYSHSVYSVRLATNIHGKVNRLHVLVVPPKNVLRYGNQKPYAFVTRKNASGAYIMYWKFIGQKTDKPFHFYVTYNGGFFYESVSV